MKKLFVLMLAAMVAIGSKAQVEKVWMDVDYVGDGIEGHKMDNPSRSLT